MSARGNYLKTQYVPVKSSKANYSKNRNMQRQAQLDQARSVVVVPRPVMGGNTRNLPANISARNPEVKALDVVNIFDFLNNSPWNF